MIARRCQLALVLLLPWLAGAQPPPAGPSPWPTVRWGMTEEEVLQALPGRAVRLDPAETLVDGRVVSVEIEHLDLAGVDFRVRFVFSRGRLALASLKNSPARLATTDDYDRLHGLLVARLSGPGAEARDESVIDYRQARWDAPGERVDLKYIPGQLVIQHGPPASSGAATPVGSGP